MKKIKFKKLIIAFVAIVAMVSFQKENVASSGTTPDPVIKEAIVAVKSYKNNVLTGTTEFTYDVTKVNKTGFGYVSYWKVPNLFGKGSKNLLTESKSFDPYGTLTYHTQYTHELEAGGYIVKQAYNFVMQGKQAVDIYSYL